MPASSALATAIGGTSLALDSHDVGRPLRVRDRLGHQHRGTDTSTPSPGYNPVTGVGTPTTTYLTSYHHRT